MSKVKNVFFGLIQVVRQNYYQITREPFHVKEDWFERVFNKHYTLDIKSKFDSNLFVDQGIGETTFEFITDPTHTHSYLLNELRVLNEWVVDFLAHYADLKTLLSHKKIPLNEKSRQYIQLELLISRTHTFFNQIALCEKVLETTEYDKVSELIPFDNENLGAARSFDLDRLSEYHIEDKFISKKPEELEELEEIEELRHLFQMVFRLSSEIINQIRTVNGLLSKAKDKVRFVHGNAGMGKSNLAAFFAANLRKTEWPVIFIKARSFSGDPDKFDKIFLENLEVPDNYKLTEVLDKLNSYGRENLKRVTIIIDGLNETSFGTNGFSPIWKKSIDDFINQLQLYPFIFFIATLRTSYIERVWESKNIPYTSEELLGFNNQGSLLKVVQKYFGHYKICFDSPDQADIFYFQTPLLLDLYCNMLNPNRTEEVNPEFGLEGFVSVFERYIDKLSVKVQNDLSLVSSEVVKNGISRCSSEMLKDMGGFLPILKYYSCVEGKEVTSVNDTIAHSILEEYLIYLKDSLENKDVVVHTQQEVGGYLLAKSLLDKYDNNVEELVNGVFFQNHIVGSFEKQHQLANDILKFLIVLSGKIRFMIKNFGDTQPVKDYSWIKLQREDSNEINLIIRDKLSEQLTSRDDYSKLLEISKARLLNPDSPLNFLLAKEDILKLKSLDFDMTWTNYIYQNAKIFNGFLDASFEGFESTGKGQLDIALEIAIWLLETTSHNIRDEVTIKLLEYGSVNPDFILSKLKEYSSTNRTYIFERLAGIAYGICLRRQNDRAFVGVNLKKFAEVVYNLQFSESPAAPSYHYIVIDSFKHIIDLAIENNVFELQDNQLVRLSKYQFTPPFEWQDVSKEDLDLVDPIVRSWHTEVDPFRGDFVHYTIPRLTNGNEAAAEATAHIHKRLRGLGYEKLDFTQPQNQSLQPFFQGQSIYELEGKVDRLGKKYSWMAFFDYAGFLLNIGQLDVWDNEEGTQRYNRLSDVGFDPSIPNGSEKSEKIYSFDLFAHRTDSEEWTYKPMYYASKELIEYQEAGKDYSLLYGMIEKRENDSYDVRSYLLIEAFLVKTQDIVDNYNKIAGEEFDWRDDFNSYNLISKVYFGELYWADNTVNFKQYYKDLPSGNIGRIEQPSEEVINKLSYLEKRHLREERDVRLVFHIEAAYSDYNWESQSEVFSGLGLTIPSTNIGKHLNLKADPKSLTFLDQNKEQATLHFSYEKQEAAHTDEQRLSYFRSDLLEQYLKDKGYTLIYQIKQHTYDRNAGNGNGDFRGMQFFTTDSLLNL